MSADDPRPPSVESKLCSVVSFTLLPRAVFQLFLFRLQVRQVRPVSPTSPSPSIVTVAGSGTAVVRWNDFDDARRNTHFRLAAGARRRQGRSRTRRPDIP